MPKFFVKDEQVDGENIKIVGEDVNHIVNVLRLKKEDEVQICNANTNVNYIANIINMNKKIVECKIKHIDNKKPLSEEIENNVENVDAENTDGNDMQDENVEQSEINGVGGRRKCGDSGSGNRTICRKNTDGIRCGVHKRKL